MSDPLPVVGNMVTALTGQDQQMTEQRPSGDDSLFEGAPYEYGAIVAAGAVLFTAGACPLDSDGSVVGLSDHVAQAGVALDNLTFALARFGARLEDLVKTTIYVVGDRSDLVAVWNVVAGRLAPHRPPSTLLGVSVLGHEGQLVEIEGIAAILGAAEGH
jgi:enamine deaminase RidA (YjgF/YER057c/UK114 family)